MDIRELTEEMNRFVTAKGWYQKNTRRPQTARNLAVSLSLESAEVLEHFQWSDEVKNSKEFRGELADVALYLLQLASVTGVDLEGAILEKLQSNYDREWDQQSTKEENQ
ncbi:MAG: nucleotide pyrophosphohydrolase [Anaerolineaceae bacterium]|nr:MAG: nucleotide pyrophosphohydrolase [Chloroflexi bacterium HGW-Chloroflexi-7]